jgi:hypothetical protein
VLGARPPFESSPPQGGNSSGFRTSSSFFTKSALSPPGETERFSEKDGVPLSRQLIS